MILNKKDIKTLIIITCILLFISFVSYFIFSGIDMKEQQLNSSFIVDGNNYWQYNDKNWKNLNSIDSINWEKYKVYTNNNYVDTYYVTSNSGKLYFFDKDNNSYHVDSPTLAISSDSNVGPINYEQEEINTSDQDIINSYLKSIKITYNGDYSVFEKYKTDLDNNGESDYIYILSNQLYSDDVFYIIFARCGSKNITINKQIVEENIEQYELAWIININSDKLPSIILKRYYLDNYEYYLYQYSKKNGYQQVLN